MARFIHTADWQIGKPYLQIKDEQHRFKLKQERLNVIARIKETVRIQKAQFVLIAGDLFDSPTPTFPNVTEVLEAIGSMSIPVIVIPGNHDHGALGSIWHNDDFKKYKAQIAPNLLLSLENQPVEIEHAVILTCPLLRNKDNVDPTHWLKKINWGTVNSLKPRIVLAHGGVHGFRGHDYLLDDEAQPSSNSIIHLKDFPKEEIDYIALGDWHNLKQVGEKAWYPGTPEADRFDQGEGNQRGQVLQVDVKRNEEPKVKIVPTGRFQWHNICFRFNGDSDIDRLRRKIETLTEGRILRDLLRIEISGVLSLNGYKRYKSLRIDLENKLLRLHIKGECYQEPKDDELEELTSSVENPLIAQVASQLQKRLQDNDNQDSELVSISRIALCELYHFAAKN